MITSNVFILLASITVFSSAEMLDVCSDSCVQRKFFFLISL